MVPHMVPLVPPVPALVTPARATLAVALVALAALASNLFVIFGGALSDAASPAAAVPCAECAPAWDALWSALEPGRLRLP